MDKSLIDKIKKTFEHDCSFDKFPDFITDIHFPCFKGLIPGSEIKFRFPLTVFQGLSLIILQPALIISQEIVSVGFLLIY